MHAEDPRLTTLLADDLRLTGSGATKLSLAFSRVLTHFHRVGEGIDSENLDEAVEELVNIVAKVFAMRGTVTMPPPD